MSRTIFDMGANLDSYKLEVDIMPLQSDPAYLEAIELMRQAQERLQMEIHKQFMSDIPLRTTIRYEQELRDIERCVSRMVSVQPLPKVLARLPIEQE